MLQIKDQIEEWELPDCINVCFVGINASALDFVDFDGDRKNKLRLSDEPDSDFEEGAEDASNGPANQFTTEPANCTEDEDELNSYPVCLQYKHKGFMVVKVKLEPTPVINEKTKTSELLNRKYIRTYYPYWKETDFENGTKRLMYETFIDLKTDNPNLAIRSRANVNPDIAEKLIEHEIITVTDCMNVILCIIVKGILGEQHIQMTFNPEKKYCMSQSQK